MVLEAGLGIRPGTRFWRGRDTYDYHVNRVMSGGRFSLRCVMHFLENCRGRASVSADGQAFRQTQPHNHDPELHRLQTRALRHALMSRCRKGDTTGFKKMYNEERRKLKVSRQAAAHIPLVKLRSSMRRARLENRPQIPHSLKDFDKVLRQKRFRKLSRTLDGKDNIYAGRAGSASRKTISLIFVTRRMRKYLRKVKKIYCDGTFSPVPRGLKACQVWTISTVRRHHVIPLVRFLMRKRTTAAYVAGLRRLKVLAPGFDPTDIMCDYEPAEQKALCTCHPDATLCGCLFHYAKDVGLNARKLKMTRHVKRTPNVRRLLRWMCVLPLLPQNRIKEGFVVVIRQAIKKRVAMKMLPIIRYWARTWLRRIPVLSVFGCTDRTSNACEAENRMLQDAVHQHRPNVWDFMDGILDLEDSTDQDIHTLKKGRNASRIRKTSAVANDKQIEAFSEELMEENISVKEFLKGTSYTIIKALNRGLNGKKKRKNV